MTKKPSKTSLGAALFSLVLIITTPACDYLSGKPVEHKYQKGQIVCLVLNGQKGMVTTRFKYHKTYVVRFVVNTQAVPSHVFGSGGDVEVRPTAEVYLKEFELKECALQG